MISARSRHPSRLPRLLGLFLCLLPPLLHAGPTATASPAPSPDVALSSLTNRLSPRACVSGTQTLALTNATASLNFQAGRRRCDLDGVVVWLNGPAVPQSNEWWFCGADATNVLLTLAASPVVSNTTPRPRVILDPGHGGTDTGASTPGGLIREKRVTLDIAQRVEEKLEAAGLDVAMTRQTDRDLTLAKRVAAQTNAHCFVSIHINSASNPLAAGIETFIVPSPGFPTTGDTSSNTNSCPGNAFDPDNTRLGYALHHELITAMKRPDRGLRRARYYVLREARCPAVLVELGFITNTPDARFLANSKQRDPIATAIANGVLRYLGRKPAPTTTSE